MQRYNFFTSLTIKKGLYYKFHLYLYIHLFLSLHTVCTFYNKRTELYTKHRFFRNHFGKIFEIIFEMSDKIFEKCEKIFVINENISVRTVRNELSDGSKLHFGRFKINFGPSKTKLFLMIAKKFSYFTELLSLITKTISHIWKFFSVLTRVRHDNVRFS